MRRPGECVVSFGRLLAQSRRAAAATSGGFWVALGWLKWGVDNVHTVRLGPRRTALEPGRFPHVSAASSCFQGWNAVRVPPRTAYPLVRVFALTCVQSLCWRPSDADAWAVAWPPRWPVQVCGVRSMPWLMGPPPAVSELSRNLVPVLSGGPRGGPQLFMDRESGDNMTAASLIRAFGEGI
jgi:hypothetical protein